MFSALTGSSSPSAEVVKTIVRVVLEVVASQKAGTLCRHGTSCQFAHNRWFRHDEPFPSPFQQPQTTWPPTSPKQDSTNEYDPPPASAFSAQSLHLSPTPGLPPRTRTRGPLEDVNGSGVPPSGPSTTDDCSSAHVSTSPTTHHDSPPTPQERLVVKVRPDLRASLRGPNMVTAEPDCSSHTSHNARTYAHHTAPTLAPHHALGARTHTHDTHAPHNDGTHELTSTHSHTHTNAHAQGHLHVHTPHTPPHTHTAHALALHGAHTEHRTPHRTHSHTLATHHATHDTHTNTHTQHTAHTHFHNTHIPHTNAHTPHTDTKTTCSHNIHMHTRATTRSHDKHAHRTHTPHGRGEGVSPPSPYVWPTVFREGWEGGGWRQVGRAFCPPTPPTPPRRGSGISSHPSPPGPKKGGTRTTRARLPSPHCLSSAPPPPRPTLPPFSIQAPRPPPWPPAMEERKLRPPPKKAKNPGGGARPCPGSSPGHPSPFGRLGPNTPPPPKDGLLSLIAD